MQRIFIVASERSGTNLLRTLLGNHSRIAAPVAPHLLNVFRPLASRYGDLSRRVPCVRLLGDMIALANHPYNDWRFPKTADDLWNDFRPTSLMEAVNAAYAGYATFRGKRHYVCKGNDLYDHAPLILRAYPDAKFIYLHRDPRDQAASWLRMPLYLHTPFGAARKWTREQNAVHRLRERGVVMHAVSYERLTADPEGTMHALCAYLQIPFEDACARTDPGNPESRRNPFWVNLSKPILSGNVGKYRDVLSEADVRILESIAREAMHRLGYEPVTAANWKAPILSAPGTVLRAIRSRWTHRKLFYEKMAMLHDKHALIRSMKSTLR